jgi:hypothetical protein
MVKTTAVVLMALVMVGRMSAHERDDLARFEGGVGVIPVSNGAGPVNPDGTLPNVKLNVVRGVNPGGGPWTIGELRADVDTDGRIDVRGRGLLLASGNSIGQNANQSVFATLICEAAAPFVEHSTTFSVPLERDGAFHIEDKLDSLPADCPSPVLLIRTSANGTWLAAGIPARGHDR